MTPTQRFVQARDFLQQHRSDYETACRGYQRPQLDSFNWALDYFDHHAKDNLTPALWVVEEDGSERKISFADMAARHFWTDRYGQPARTRWPSTCACAACGAATACC